MGFKLKNLVKAVLNPVGAIATATAANNAADAAKKNNQASTSVDSNASNQAANDALARANAPAPIVTLNPSGVVTTTTPAAPVSNANTMPIETDNSKTYGIIGLVVILMAIIAIAIYYFKTK